MPDQIFIEQQGDRQRGMNDHCVLVVGLSPDKSTFVPFVVDPATGALAVGGASGSPMGVVEVAAPANSQPGASFFQQAVSVATAGVPQTLGPGMVQSVELFARKDQTTPNVGNIYVGFQGQTSYLHRILGPGEVITFTAPAGKVITLESIYIDAAISGDGVVVTGIA